MLGDRRQAHAEWLGELGYADVAFDGKLGENGAPGGIGESGEDGGEAVGAHVVLNLVVN